MLPRPTRRLRAFTLVELMVVILIISVLAMLAVPGLARVQRKAKTSAILNDFRVFAAAFEAYAQDNGTWPPESAVGVVPDGMSGYLSEAAWTKVTPMGGRYDWENDQLHRGERHPAVIRISSAPGAPLVSDWPLLSLLERAIDRPPFDYYSGSFRLGANSDPLYLVQP